jgi:hypothetical protein
MGVAVFCTAAFDTERPIAALQTTSPADIPAVYRAVLSDGRGADGREPLVVGAETEDAALISDFDRRMAFLIPRFTARLPSGSMPDGLLEAFRRVYAARLPLDARQLGVSSVTMLTRAEFDEMFPRAGSLMEHWDAFFKRFGTGMTHVSAIAFSTDNSWALLTVSHACGGLCGFGEFVLLQKTNGAWRVVAKEGAWVS